MRLAGECRAGYYCTGGATSPTACNGTEDGFACAHGGACEKGDACPAGTTYKQECPPGRFCANGTGVTGLCAAGHYCQAGAYTARPRGVQSEGGATCPAGHYCPVGQGSPIACGVGYYSASPGNKLPSDCVDCTPGYVCGNASIVTPSELCPDGYYCPNGTSAATLACPAGSACPEGSAEPAPCAAGTYQNLGAQPSCIVCPAGFYCPYASGASSEHRVLRVARGGTRKGGSRYVAREETVTSPNEGSMT